jgi:hypothetical protein
MSRGRHSPCKSKVNSRERIKDAPNMHLTPLRIRRLAEALITVNSLTSLA